MPKSPRRPSATAITSWSLDIVSANKAPGGFGLGTTPQLITDWNDVKVGGWFWSYEGADNAPDPTLSCFGTAYNQGNPEVFVQEVWGLANVNKYYHWMRLVYPGTGNGTPWEWPNPPMKLGVEYRTTERYLDKPVYVMAVDLGAAPNATTKGITIKSSEVKELIFASFRLPSSEMLPYKFNSHEVIFNTAVYSSGELMVFITSKDDQSMMTVTGIVKYTKTTD